MSSIQSSGFPEKSFITSEKPILQSYWKPTSLKRHVLAGILFGALILLGCTTSLHFKDQKDGAVLFATGATGFSSVQDFLVRYLPTILVVLYGMLVAVIDLDVKRLEPWYQLSADGVAPQGSPLLCRYDTDFVLTVMARALRSRYVPVCPSSMLY